MVAGRHPSEGVAMSDTRTDSTLIGELPITRINPSPWSQAVGYDQAQLRPYPSQLLTVAAQASTDSDGSLLHDGDVVAQMALAVRNLEEILDEAGMTLADLTRLTVYAVDVAQVHTAHAALFEPLAAAGATPPITLVGVTSLAAPGMAVALEATAAR
jgi:enamine deaminase RidA (YjgF/YER057c/UK114 family)